MRVVLRIPKLGAFVEAVDNISSDAARGARPGVDNAMADWEKDAWKIALMKSGHLRDSIEGKPTTGSGLNLIGTFHSDAIAPWGSGSFNYSYYWHEVKTPRTTTTPGTTGKHIEETGENNGSRYVKTVEKEIIEQWKARGW